MRTAQVADSTCYRSILRWPTGQVDMGNPDNVSIETHNTAEQAGAFCQLIATGGYGNQGRIFPVSTRIEAIGG